MGDILTIPFNGTVLAGAEKTLVSRRLDFAYRVTRLRVSFPLNTNRTTQVSFFVSPDGSTPSTGKPTGQDLMGQYSATPYFVGDDEYKDMEHSVSITGRGTYIKVYALNSDAFNHIIDAQVMIERLES